MPLSEKWRLSESGLWKVGTTKVAAPLVSIKDLWVDPREQVLNVLIACRWSGSGKPSSLVSTDVWLSLLLHWLARERNWVWTCGSDKRHIVDCVRSSFSREQWLCPTLSMTHKRLLYVDHIRYIWPRAIRGSSVESMCRVGQIFSCRVYIDLNYRDSRIWVTAYSWQPSRS
jgi:hypothetical protein